LAFVDVEVGDRSCRFLLDTGASLSVIRADVAEAAGVAPVAEEASFGTGTARTISVHPAVIPRLRLGNAILKNHPCVIAKREDLEQKWLGLSVFHIEGVLGWNAIAKLDLEIDFRTSRATVRQPRLRSVERNMLWLRAPIVRCRLDGGMPILAGLDTGAVDSYLPEPFFNVIPEDARARLVGRTRGASKTVWSVGGSERSQRKRVERLGVVLGGNMLEFRNLHSGRRWPSAIFVALLTLGADVGHGGLIRIDATNGAFEIEMGK
jgi:hypothetical protein